MLRIFALTLCFLMVPPTTQAVVPFIEFSLNPPQFMDCDVGPDLGHAFNCISTEVQALAEEQVEDALRAAAETHAGVLSELEAAHTQTLSQLESQIGQLQSQLRSAQRAAGSAGRTAGRQTESAIGALTGPAAELQSCLASRGVDTKSLFTQPANPVTVARAQLQNMWEGLFVNLQSYQLPGLDPSRPPTTQQLMQRAEAFAGQIAQREPMTQCLWSMSQPFRTQALQVAGTLFNTVNAQFQNAITQVARPAAQRAMAPAIRSIFSSIVDTGAQGSGAAAHAAARASMAMLPNDVREQIMAAALARMINSSDMRALTRAIDKFASSLNTPSTVIRNHREVVAKMSQVRTLSDEEAAVIGADIVRMAGHAYIDSEHGQFAVDTVIAGLELIVDGILAGGNSGTGTFSQPTATVSNFISLCIKFGVKNMASIAGWSITKASHVAWEQTMVGVRRASGRRAGAPSARVTAAMGEYGDLLRYFPSEADLIAYTSVQLEQIRQDLANYHAAVLKLADVARTAANTAGTPADTSRTLKSSTTRTPTKTSAKTPPSRR